MISCSLSSLHIFEGETLWFFSISFLVPICLKEGGIMWYWFVNLLVSIRRKNELFDINCSVNILVPICLKDEYHKGCIAWFSKVGSHRSESRYSADDFSFVYSFYMQTNSSFSFSQISNREREEDEQIQMVMRARG